MTEKEKMLLGELYDPTDKELSKLRSTAHDLSLQYNALPEGKEKKRASILRKLLPSAGENLYLQGPIYFDYGHFTKFGKNCYANFNFTVLDCAPVEIGNDVFFGPNVAIYTPMHALNPEQRRQRTRKDGSLYDYEYAKPIKIGNDCWIAGNVVIIGGVTIGDGCVIGAGSVVTKDIPPHSLAVGNPCRVIRTITKEDDLKDFPNE